jgi:hypothetical protein
VKKSNLFLISAIATLFFISCSHNENHSSDLFRMQENIQPRCFNFENPTGAKGAGGKENAGAKGHAFEWIKPGEQKVLFDLQECGVINHIWFTLNEPSPKLLRSLKIEMYWDNAEKPAVQVPFGDFFCNILGKTSSFENYFFSNPESRSFNCYAQMPFRKAARIVLTNESANPIIIFYDINFSLTKHHDKSVMYFHACWNRIPATILTQDFTIMPEVKGKGRYLGAHIGLITNPLYNKAWWGEGEVKMYLDGDKDNPTIIGTGSEDYPGSGYGLGKFNHQYQGCLVADDQKGEYGFYRYHIVDPIFFNEKCRVTMQQIGGAYAAVIEKIIQQGAPFKLVSFTPNNPGTFIKFLELPKPPETSDYESLKLNDGWVNFYRSDDWSAVALFYLDSPENGLPAITNLGIRTQGIDN